ncbi:MAG TPA: type 1 glutamine amidotransferase domain-containing protein [Nitrospirota bacterium]|jgi:protease I
MKALIISANDFEDLELYYPYYRLKEEGWDITIAAPDTGTIAGKHGYSVPIESKFSDINPDEFDILFIPGGRAPEEVRINENALRIVNSFFDDGKIVASICHGAQVLVSANRVLGRKITCWKGVRDDVLAAGGLYTDTEVVVDGNLVSSRMPVDLPAFMRELMKLTRMAVQLEQARRAA